MTSISLRDVSVVFERSGTRTTALDGLNLELDSSEYVSVIGPNGAGKSTLVNVIAGTVQPTSGRVEIGGKDVSRLPDYRRAQWIARVFQDPTRGTCDGLTVMQNIALGLKRGQSRSAFSKAFRQRDFEYAKQLLMVYGRDLEQKLDQDVTRLSGGQRQLVSMLMAMAGSPEILLLDEHTSALDPAMGEQLMEQTDQIVRAQGLTTIMITHNMRLAAQFGDRLLVMNAGKVMDDIKGEERKSLTENSLLERFRRNVSSDVTDRLVG